MIAPSLIINTPDNQIAYVYKNHYGKCWIETLGQSPREHPEEEALVR